MHNHAQQCTTMHNQQFAITNMRVRAVCWLLEEKWTMLSPKLIFRLFTSLIMSHRRFSFSFPPFFFLSFSFFLSYSSLILLLFFSYSSLILLSSFSSSL